MSAYEAEQEYEDAVDDVVARVTREFIGETASESDCDRIKMLFGLLRAGDPLPGGNEVKRRAA